MPVNCQPDSNCPTPSKCSEFVDASCVYLQDGIYDAALPPLTSVEEAIQQLTLMITNPNCTDTDSCNCDTVPTLLLKTNDTDNDSQTILNNKNSYGVIITDNGSGDVSYESFLNENKAVVVDLTYGDNATAQKYNLTRPYATIAAAITASTTGDVIVLNAGTYNVGGITAIDGIDFYCKPGVILNNTGFFIFSNITWNLYGYAVFTGSTATPITVAGGTGIGNIFVNFDKISGAMATAVLVSAPTATSFNFTLNCNSIKTITGGTSAQNCFRINNSLNANISVNVRNFIIGDQRFIVRLGGFNPPVSMQGTVNITCPIIQSSSTIAQRTVIYLEMGLTVQGAKAYKIVINSDRIIQDPAIALNVSEQTGFNLISSCVFIDGGDNIYIKGDLEGNNCLAVASRTAGGPGGYIAGTIVFEGNISSNIECISSCCKVFNGNGWHNLVFKNGTITTKGNGQYNCVVLRPGINDTDLSGILGWNSTNAGTNGYLQFVNCVLYNENIPNSATATGIITSGFYDEKILSYNTVIKVVGGTSLITTSNVSESVLLSNTQGNLPLAGAVTDLYGSYTANSLLNILNF
jgi:hypothetical protein